MDVVSDAISAVRVGRPSSDRMRVDGSWCVRFAPYDGAGFHVVLEGGCWLLPDGGPPVSLGPGDAVLLPHGTGHVIADSPADARAVARAVPFESARAPWRTGPGGGGAGGAGGAVEMLCGKYRLDRSRAHPLMAELPPVVHLPNRVGSHPELRSAIDLLGRELDGQRPGGGVAVPSLLDLLLVYMIRSWLTAEGTAGSWPAALGDPVAAAALRALHADPAAPWTIERLAAEAGVSRPTLARRFTALVGRPPMAYLTWWRLNLAAGLLRGTEDPLAAVARRVGYGTPYALSHAFSREFGTTPGRYRAGEAAGVPHTQGRTARAGGAARGPGAPRSGGAAPAG
ncbi:MULTISPECIES: AraC family transcriptional regulator [Streptomyces]|uniref:AraC family transcriptional regulator n=1 Tax=Streptomyces TaxID=1883 RepID=UPI000F7AB56A|nr:MULTISPECIES: AraC family transcriptional regulator [Streptomyces]RST04579.1 AraC family transcriptional regulator [Streptomyces sp. WAC07149]GLX21554.1 AraC family transcriptional regulator [Streptomyces lavendulae subsp. lavendulae]GLX28971.1 AraC family transcriptional regulator [Streptomyces lavendulae subsp. lavendulae]